MRPGKRVAGVRGRSSMCRVRCRGNGGLRASRQAMWTRTRRTGQSNVAWLLERFDERRKNGERFLRGMQAVAGILPLDYVGNARCRLRRLAFDEGIRVLVVVAENRWSKHTTSGMSGGQPAGSRPAPRGDELVGLRPAVEADAERVAAENAESFGERGREPRGIGIVLNSAAIAGAMACAKCSFYMPKGSTMAVLLKGKNICCACAKKSH
jgi:hypothetical protein